MPIVNTGNSSNISNLPEQTNSQESHFNLENFKFQNLQTYFKKIKEIASSEEKAKVVSCLMSIIYQQNISQKDKLSCFSKLTLTINTAKDYRMLMGELRSINSQEKRTEVIISLMQGILESSSQGNIFINCKKDYLYRTFRVAIEPLNIVYKTTIIDQMVLYQLVKKNTDCHCRFYICGLTKFLFLVGILDEPKLLSNTNEYVRVIGNLGVYYPKYKMIETEYKKDRNFIPDPNIRWELNI